MCGESFRNIMWGQPPSAVRRAELGPLVQLPPSFPSTSIRAILFLCNSADVAPPSSLHFIRMARSTNCPAQSGRVAGRIGIDFLVPCGTTGETPTLTHDEWLRRDRHDNRSRSTDASPSSREPHRTPRTKPSRKPRKSPRARRRCHPDRVAVLQQAHAGRPVPALQSHRRSRRRQAHHSLQRARTYRREHRTADAGAARRDSATSSA